MNRKDATEYMHAALWLLRACPKCGGPNPTEGGSWTHSDGTVDVWLECERCGHFTVMERSRPLLDLAESSGHKLDRPPRPG